MSKVVWLILRLILCYYTAVQIKKRPYFSENCPDHIEVGRRGKRDGGKSDVLVLLLTTEVVRGYDFDAKVHKINEFLPETKSTKKVKYIDNGNIALEILNWSKFRLNRFGTIRLVKNYRAISKLWHHTEKPSNESVPILKPIGPSSPCKTVKNSKISNNQLNAIKENLIDSIRKLKLSNHHKVILGHLNVNSLWNKFESIAVVIQVTLDIFLLSETKTDESLPDEHFCLNNFKIFRKDRN